MPDDELNRNDIMDYAYNVGLMFDDPVIDELPESDHGGMLEERIVNEQIPSYGLFDPDYDDRLIAVGGIHPVNDHCGETWAKTYDPRYRKSILKIGGMLMDWFQQDFVRLQTMIRCDNENAKKFNELLGFEVDARLERFTEYDWWLMSRVDN
jgi:hypothetical protein